MGNDPSTDALPEVTRRIDRRAAGSVAAAVAVVAVTAAWLTSSLTAGDERAQERNPVSLPARRFASNDPVERACALDRRILARLWRGTYKRRGGDLIMVPQHPNYSGGFQIPGHTGPWRYLQEVPLVVYGPRRIAAGREVQRPVAITDVFPTVGRLTKVGLPPRDGRPLSEALRAGVGGRPRLILTVVWDGVGNNVLARWPDRWPRLSELIEEGTSYTRAVLGSSPSVTPATHANLGVGAFPRSHGVTGIYLRSDTGRMTTAMRERDPKDLELTTYADEIDRALGNHPEVGMLAWKSWHMTMLGHGSQLAGGDADELALIGSREGDITGNDRWYSTPAFLPGFPGLERHAEEVDREDGKADGVWLGHDPLEMHDNPAWVRYQRDLALAMLRRGGYGRDAVPDLFLMNFKVTDIVGHQYTMESREMGEVLEEQDAALGALVDYLDAHVGDYVVFLTADHGHTRPWNVTGGWPFVVKELHADINHHFGVAQSESLIEATSPSTFFFDRARLRAAGVTGAEVAEFANAYTIEENWREGELPEPFSQRRQEHVLSAAFLRSQFPEVMRCAFGSRRPPPGFPS